MPRVDGRPARARFVFSVSVATRDRPMLDALRQFLGAGSIHTSPARRANWQPMATFTIASNKGHRRATIPFADTFLLPCAKRRQFEQWRERLVEHEREHPSRQRSQCSVEGCAGLVRGRGLCRSHYYRATGY
jgi:hypothetical protein